MDTKIINHLKQYAEKEGHINPSIQTLTDILLNGKTVYMDEGIDNSYYTVNKRVVYIDGILIGFSYYTVWDEKRPPSFFDKPTSLESAVEYSSKEITQTFYYPTNSTNS